MKFVSRFLLCAILLVSPNLAMARSHHGGGGGGGTTGTTTVTATNVVLTAGTTYPNATGQASYRTVTRTPGTTTTTTNAFEISVRKTGLAVGTVLSVSVAGTVVGTATVTHCGARLVISSTSGATPPVITTTTAITVTDPSGATVLSNGSATTATTTT